jgi:hypothetical protein
MNQLRFAVVILNWNGKNWLEKFLPSVIEHTLNAEIIIADNNSTDDSEEFIKQHYKTITFIKNEKNLGFAGGYNEVLNKINTDVFVLLNSDVEVGKNWLNPIREHLEKNLEVGACQPKIIDFYKRESFEYAGACGGYIDYLGYPFCRGRIFNTLETDKNQYENIEEIFWATGACLVVRSEVFHAVGGFDADYFAHMEEIDLCWRIKNIGKKITVVPESAVFHVGGGTLNKLSPKKTYLNFRNSLITLVKNDSGSFLIFKVLLRLLLDGIAGTKFLIELQPSHTFAVLKAHFSFYSNIYTTLRKRKEMKLKPEFTHTKSCIYNQSIVWQYYIAGKRIFSALSFAASKP